MIESYPLCWPDRGGDTAHMAALNRAREEALKQF